MADDPVVVPVLQDSPMLIATDEAGRNVEEPTRSQLSTLLANLWGHNGFLILHREDEDLDGAWYIQTQLLQDRTFELEYRDGVAAEHYQTQTSSRAQVLAAMVGWAAGEADWRDGFTWNNIGHMFAPHAAADPAEPTAPAGSPAPLEPRSS
jgi:hypothetical protein